MCILSKMIHIAKHTHQTQRTPHRKIHQPKMLSESKIDSHEFITLTSEKRINPTHKEHDQQTRKKKKNKNMHTPNLMCVLFLILPQKSSNRTHI